MNDRLMGYVGADVQSLCRNAVMAAFSREVCTIVCIDLFVE